MPSAYLDFGIPPRREERPQEAFAALLMWCRQLAGHGLHFPLYDFATMCRRSLEIAANDEKIQRHASVARLRDDIQAQIEQVVGNG